MDILAQIDKMHLLKGVMLLLALMFALFILIAGWLYLLRSKNSASLIDLDPPANIDHLIRISMVISVITLISILGIFLTGFY